MSFGEVFADIRRRRRIPMRLFSERVGVSPSYIHDIEQGTTIPGLEKLEAIATVLREVAHEQGAADPEAEGRILLRAREETLYIDRLHVDPRRARIFVALGELDEGSLAAIEEPIVEAIDFFSRLETPFQRGVGQALLDAMSVVDRLDPDEQKHAGMEIANAVVDVLTSIKTRLETVDDGVVPATHPIQADAEGASTARRRSRQPAG